MSEQRQPAGRRGLLIVISGPSAVGKDTIVKRLLELDDQIRYSVSYTTRSKRDYEVDGKHYSFVDEEEFARLVQDGELLEHAVYNGCHYGTSASRVEQARAAGLDILLKIEVQGAEQVRRRCPDGIFIFIAPPSMDELIRRRLGRGTESPEALEARQRLAEVEMGFADLYDHIVVNKEVDKAAREIREIVQQAREREGRS